MVALVLATVLLLIAATPAKAEALEPLVIVAVVGLVLAGIVLIAYLVIANVEGERRADEGRVIWVAQHTGVLTGGPAYGSDLVVDLLRAVGVEHVALNPGATFRGLHDSLVNYGGGAPELILTTHEEIAVALAHGYAKAKGRPMAAVVARHRRPAAREHGDLQRVLRPRARSSSSAAPAPWTPPAGDRGSTGSTPRSCRAPRCATT